MIAPYKMGVAMAIISAVVLWLNLYLWNGAAVGMDAVFSTLNSLPLSAKIGITVIFTTAAWYVGFVGGIRLIEDPKRWRRYIYLGFASFVLLLSPSLMYG